MNVYQTRLWNDLCNLVDSNDAFYSQDYVTDDRTLRIFNYRMASYTDFMLPSALECRGIMFDVTDLENPFLVSLPMEKFFNLNENPYTMNLDLSMVVDIQEKADGSLISTYKTLSGELALKSKGAIASDQAVDATKWLYNEAPIKLICAIDALADAGFTVNMEWVAPWNRVVMAYQEPRLIVLNIRNNTNGEYITDIGPYLTSHEYAALHEYWRGEVQLGAIGNIPEFIAQIPDMEGIEGYILQLASGQHVKIKTHWYLVQHRAKDSVNSDRRLFETVVADAQDDLRSLFFDDPWVLERIEWMEGLVGDEYNKMVASVEKFYEENKHLERKDYAIKGQQEVKPLWFSLCMNLYLGKDNDYKGFMMSKWKAYGIKDQQKDEK